ncbi:SAM-dependent methyltransferase [Actinacidiphila acidipaludis]|uniref:SAM-dependent methyltransferase n=1 Tax=Actinacidiphila acidipaludis TaxID=2873382 RepID=A0ABS7QAD1_9ACTN|nr:SAM-dependent methyltransferase [Streptomyces acidipaludis]MBY8880077.1 SAM-dependent methyltransferase [Streptomyces acidipaludis]
MDWHAWHGAYDSPDSPLAVRLHTVQRQISLTLDEARPGPIRVISACAGQGRDLIGALDGHPRRADVTARLVELDARNTAEAHRAAGALGLSGVTSVTGDAALTDAYTGMAPADLVLLCGIFGNITLADIERVTGYCTRLCAENGIVIWTRNRHRPDVFPRVCDWFEERGFVRVWANDPELDQGVGVHRFTGRPAELPPGERMFTFVGYDVLRGADHGA